MSQIPPPPPGQPTPTGGTGAVGSNKNLYTILAWALLPPIGSLIFLFVGKDDPDVKYNATTTVTCSIANVTAQQSNAATVTATPDNPGRG